MRLAVIADMHGNSHALEAILADAERVGVDAIAFLGDFVSDCADPEGVLALAREAARAYPCWAVRGNREEYQVRYAEGQEAWRADSRTGSLLYTAQRLSAADIAYFRRVRSASLWMRGRTFCCAMVRHGPRAICSRLVPPCWSKRFRMRRRPGTRFCCWAIATCPLFCARTAYSR